MYMYLYEEKFKYKNILLPFFLFIYFFSNSLIVQYEKRLIMKWDILRVIKHQDVMSIL